MTFQEALAEHLAAIPNRDLDRSAATLGGQAGELALILPTGRFIGGREQVLEFHRDWFADPDGTFSTNTLKIHEGADTAYALLKVDYAAVDATGAAYTKSYHLNLIFAYRDGRWGLVHDQNTLI